MPLRMIATDLDGTIVGSGGAVSARTVAALRSAREAGVVLVFVTGRPPRWLAEVVEATGHQGVAVCANGALVVDAASWQVLSASPLPRSDVLAVTSLLRDHLPGSAFAVETPSGFAREPAYAPRWDGEHTTTATDELTRLVTDDETVVKILCRNESMTSDDLMTSARSVLDGDPTTVSRVHVTHSNALGGLIEISGVGVSKAATLSDVAAAQGIDACDVVAFGDMPNDVEMLRWAGVGYAMADGHPEAIAAADQVAPSVDQDGVARVVETLVAALTDQVPSSSS